MWHDNIFQAQTSESMVQGGWPENNKQTDKISESFFKEDIYSANKQDFQQKKKGRQRVNHDRFIPERKAMNNNHSQFFLYQKENMMEQGNLKDGCENNQLKYTKMLESQIFNEKKKIITFNSNDNSQMNLQDSLQQSFLNYQAQVPVYEKTQRLIAQSPEKILDAPDLLNDFYLNLMDWSSQGVIAISLDQSLYMYNSFTNQISHLLSTPDLNGESMNQQTTDSSVYISSVNFMPQNSNLLSIGFSDSSIQMWDVEQKKTVRQFQGHTDRVSVLCHNNAYMLASGSKDKKLIWHDVRQAKYIQMSNHHQQEVCGLKYNVDSSYLASGANDNQLLVWDHMRMDRPRWQTNIHRGAVKAMAWCPQNKNLLASGGGTADKTLKFWNADSGQLISSTDTESQVCCILWNKHDKNELISSHGFSKNQITVWKYQGMQRIAELEGHKQRVLHMCLSPDGSVVCSAGDETLRFWRVFATPYGETNNSKKDLFLNQNNNLSIR